MKYFGQDFLQRVSDSLNIADVIGSYVPLKKRGNRYWGCCPFHHEKTPSFSVSPDKGLYYCFGCHASGNLFTFVQKMENLTFPEAVEHLAEIAHIELPQEEISAEEQKKQSEMSAMYEAAKLAADYFHNCLTKTRMGEAGMAYFRRRHLTPENIAYFKLGFAPPEWDRLFRDFTQKKQIRPEILRSTGLVGYSNGRYFDMFRNRCMFPILNLKGHPVAFGGRVLDDSKPKYLNSPETPIFNKRRLLFALYQALPKIRETRQVIMVEGYMDAISLHTHGVTNVVASLGTAFTIEQARLLKRYADEVIFSYDMDSAGQNATRRALEIAGTVGLKIRVARVGEGKDPDEFVNLHGGEAYLEAVRQAQPAMDYLLASLLHQYDATSLEGQQHILQEMFAVLTTRDDSMLINSYIRKMAQAMRLDEGLIRSEATRYVKKNHMHVYISPKENTENVVSRESQKLLRLEESFLRYCMQVRRAPSFWPDMKGYEYHSPFCSRLASIMEEFQESGQPLSEKLVQQKLEPEDMEALAALLMREEDDVSVPWEEFIRPLKLGSLQKAYKEHTERANALAHEDPEASRQEMLTCIRLNREIQELQQKSSV